MSTLIVRKIEVDLAQGFGRHWNGGDAYRTQLFNALSIFRHPSTRGGTTTGI
jgi:predicted metal-dependent hydrolase